MQTLKKIKTKLGNTVELLGTPDKHQALIIGVIHGDEPQGKFLIEEYLNCSLAQDYPTSKSKISVLPQGEDTLRKYDKHLITLGQNLRNNSTKQEIILWQHLKQKQLGVKFRRQQPIGKYIVDFVCFEKNLIIELDGGQHNQNTCIQNDIKRTIFLEKSGFSVLRFWNSEITENLDGVIQKIKTYLCPPLEGGPKSLISRWGKKLFIPCLNPDGLQLNTRCNANGVDINRNFPTKNWGEDTSKAGTNPANYYSGTSPASEIETKFVIDVIEKYQPELILTLHAPYKIVNYDGPAKDIAQKISDIIKYPVEPSIGYPTPGSFGTWAGVEKNIPIITLELDEKISVEKLLQPIFEIFELFN